MDNRAMPTVDEWEMLATERIWTDTQCEYVPLFASVVTSRSYGVMVLDCYTTPLSPLSHSILMEWCVYKHQEWYPLHSERILHFSFSQCLQSVVRLLGCGLCLHHSSSMQHHRRNIFGSRVTQTGIQNVFG